MLKKDLLITLSNHIDCFIYKKNLIIVIVIEYFSYLSVYMQF